MWFNLDFIFPTFLNLTIKSRCISLIFFSCTSLLDHVLREFGGVALDEGSQSFWNNFVNPSEGSTIHSRLSILNLLSLVFGQILLNFLYSLLFLNEGLRDLGLPVSMMFLKGFHVIDPRDSSYAELLSKLPLVSFGNCQLLEWFSRHHSLHGLFNILDMKKTGPGHHKQI